MAVKKTFEFFFSPLLKKFFQDMGRDPNNLEMILLRQKAGQQLKDSSKIINFPQNKSFMEQVEAMKKSGDIVDKDNIIISDKITNREMFKNSNLNKPTIEGQMEKITGASNKIKEIQKEIDNMYKPKSDAEIKAKFDKQNKEAVERLRNKRQLTDDEIKDYEAELGDSETWMMDGTVGEAETALKNQKAYIRDMELEYKKGNLDPKPGEPNREKFLQKKYDEMEASGDNKLMTREEIEELSSFGLQKDMDKSVKKFKEKDAKQKKTLKDFDPEDRDPNATGGRAGFYTGGITDVEPSLDDIGHGSDALMARTRLMAPNSQATTSTGLNYLLAEDNDNMRIPFAGGGGGGRRAFLKLMATLGGGIAGIKSGMVGLGEGGAKKAVTETVKQSAGGTYPPPYFFKLVEKIKFMGDDITEKAATQEREIVKRYKDYEMTEDIGTGNIVIKKRNEGSFYDQDGIISDEYIVYKPGQADELTKGKKPPPEYDEYTVRPDGEGKLRDSEDGLDSIDEILEEVGDTTAMTLKKADGGRIGYVGGGLSKLGITGSSRKFLEKVFGKQKLQNLIENDPELHRGLLEVAEMFRSKDKSGLIEYMQNFLPQMSKKELEAFVVGSGDTAGIEGQLIRLGSGRDYKNKIEMIEEANNIRKLKDFDIEGVSKNAEGGRIGFSGGGIYRAIIARSAARAGMKPYEYIKKTSYKSLPPEVKMFMSKADFEQLKLGQEQMYSNYIDMAKTRLNFQKEIEGGKKTPAKELFEGMEKTMDEQSYVPKNVNEKDIGEMELMFKNRFLKDRKDNADGGIQTMLGE